MLTHRMKLWKWLIWPFARERRDITKYDVAPRLGIRTVERRIRQRLPGATGALHTTVC